MGFIRVAGKMGSDCLKKGKIGSIKVSLSILFFIVVPFLRGVFLLFFLGIVNEVIG